MSHEFRVRAPIKKTSEASDGTIRMWGWAAMSRDDLDRPVVDSDGEYIPIDELESAAQRAFLRRGGKGSVGVMHQAFARADLVESFVMSAAKREAFGFGEGPQGWMVGLISDDPEVAQLVRSGRMLELSIRGTARVRRTQRTLVKGAKAPFGEGDYGDDVGVMEGLELADVELLSIVDRGASANERVRPKIVLIKREREGRMKPNGKARSAQQIVADLLESGALSDMAAEDKDTLLTAVGGATPPASDAPPTDAPADSGMAQDDEEEGTSAAAPADDGLQKQAKALEKRATTLAKENAELSKRLRDLERKAEDAELRTMVKTEMAFVPGSTETIVKMLREARENMSADDAKALEDTLRATSEAMRKSDLFKVHGFGRDAAGATGTAYAQLKDLAKGLKEKDPALSMADAIVKAGRERPDLWAQHKEEQRR